MLYLIAFTCLSMGAWEQKEKGHSNRKRNDGRYGHHKKHHIKNYLHKNDLLSNKINRVTQADSIQAKRMNPIIDKTSARTTNRFSTQEKYGDGVTKTTTQINFERGSASKV